MLIRSRNARDLLSRLRRDGPPRRQGRAQRLSSCPPVANRSRRRDSRVLMPMYHLVRERQSREFQVNRERDGTSLSKSTNTVLSMSRYIHKGRYSSGTNFMLVVLSCLVLAAYTRFPFLFSRHRIRRQAIVLVMDYISSISMMRQKKIVPFHNSSNRIRCGLYHSPTSSHGFRDTLSSPLDHVRCARKYYNCVKYKQRQIIPISATTPSAPSDATNTVVRHNTLAIILPGLPLGPGVIIALGSLAWCTGTL